MIELPRHVIPKKLASGATAYYYNLPTKYRKLKCPVGNEPLGTDFAKMKTRADVLNGQFDEWDQQRKGLPVSAPNAPKYGTVDWLFREYKASKAYLEKVAQRSRRDYEWAMDQICDIKTKAGDRVGSRPVKSISPRAADKLYDKFLAGEVKEDGDKKDGAPEKLRLRTGEKLVGLCRKAWRVVHRLFPDEFDKAISNPWTGVTLKVRTKKKKAAVTRDEVYVFAEGAIELGEIEAAAVAVICFEWLQRPENVVAGHIKWSGYRTGPRPTIRIEHHKTGEIVDHPLEADGVKFYEEAEEVLSRLSRLGTPMILYEVGPGKAKTFGMSTMQHKVQRIRKALNLPKHFTFDACRHGGMTELEEAELTDGQGRALSAHRTQQSYAGYAKRTEKRMLAATRKRHAHRLANETATDVQNEQQKSVQNEHPEQSAIGE
ncbi:hypothetical protein AB7008_15060 [Bradyrhizobium sp. 521_C7_N1_3]|uniref:hypothetical protein n=1 Tax=Bradyrhizobium sp. 521_C7_N1_3 TaxID=3240368 RepID=UPI003F8C2984